MTTMADDMLFDIALASTQGIDPHTTALLIEEFSSAREILNSSVEELTSRGVSLKFAQMLTNRQNVEHAKSTLNICNQTGVKAIVKGKSHLYPKLLAEVWDAPHVLYQFGEVNLNDYKLLSVVGTRSATEYGLRATEELVQDVANSYSNVAVVSGLAIGIDKAAHSAALSNNIPTMAFLPGWVLDIAPTQHRELAREIVRRGGAILSDRPYQSPINKSSFLFRNRLVAGVSAATIVIESPMRGGSINTARLASSCDRAVFALPGRLSDKNSVGTNYLIKSARAILYQSVNDISAELGWSRKDSKEFTQKEIEKLEPSLLSIYKSIENSDSTFSLEEIGDRLNIDLNDALSALVQLEISGLIRSLPGGLFCTVETSKN